MSYDYPEIGEAIAIHGALAAALMRPQLDAPTSAWL